MTEEKIIERSKKILKEVDTSIVNLEDTLIRSIGCFSYELEESKTEESVDYMAQRIASANSAIDILIRFRRGISEALHGLNRISFMNQKTCDNVFPADKNGY